VLGEVSLRRFAGTRSGVVGSAPGPVVFDPALATAAGPGAGTNVGVLPVTNRGADTPDSGAGCVVPVGSSRRVVRSGRTAVRDGAHGPPGWVGPLGQVG
jgi:hypothetical protein